MKLERLGDLPAEYDVSEFRLLLRELDRNFERLNKPFSDRVYTVTGFTERRTIDCSTATVQQLCELVTTMLFDQWRHGRMRLDLDYASSVTFAGTAGFTATSNYTVTSATFSGTSGVTASGTVV